LPEILSKIKTFEKKKAFFHLKVSSAPIKNCNIIQSAILVYKLAQKIKIHCSSTLKRMNLIGSS